MFYIPFVVGIATYILSRRYKETFLNITNEQLMNDVQTGTDLIKNLEGSCKTPSKDNPFMNVRMSDYINNPYKPEACDVTRNDIQEEITKNFSHNLYKNNYLIPIRGS